MLFTKHHYLFILLYIYFFCLLTFVNSCNIWKASDCPQPPTAADEEIMIDDLYTREQLFQFCDKGKKYIECVNKQLQCCDLKSEHAGALAAFEVGLQQAGWRLGRHCAGLGGDSMIYYKCKTTRSPTVRTTTTTTSTTSTIPPCEVEEAGKECNDILNSRLRFKKDWTVFEKIRWCKTVRDYIRCADKYITNCSIIDVRDDVEQLSNFMKHIQKEADRECQGGFKGCDNAITDVRCTQSSGDYYNGKVFGSAIQTLIINWYLFFFIALILWWNR
ncbi:unnamed protein product [Adineta steineri]|uniref:Uncharacterized protein n=1 Tax=Adineta steineri TaxID=433720 RepID=A0A818PUX0_9BILA|nr:unnamed protein product [Adineta steineri]CAF3631106.1 unnamed protein product [Adineta steineri]